MKCKNRQKQKKKRSKILLIAATVIGTVTIGTAIYAIGFFYKANVSKTSDELLVSYVDCGDPSEYKMNNSYEMSRVPEDNSTGIIDDKVVRDNLSYEEMLDKFYEQFYSEVTNEEIEERVMEKAYYYQSSGYFEAVTEYWENVREVTDVANKIEPLYFTDMKYYTDEELQNVPQEIIHLAKNEIYARRGYIFKDQDLNSYFMGCAWYQPTYSSEEFSDSVFNDYEKYNLQLLTKLDK